MPFRRMQLFCSEWVIMIYLQPPNWCVCWHWFPTVRQGCLTQTYDSQSPLVMSPARLCLLQALSRSPHIFSSSIIIKTTRSHTAPRNPVPYLHAFVPSAASPWRPLSLSTLPSQFPALLPLVLNLGQFSPLQNMWQCLKICLVVTAWGKVLPAGSRWTRMLLIISHASPPPQKTAQSEMPTGPCWETPRSHWAPFFKSQFEYHVLWEPACPVLLPRWAGFALPAFSLSLIRWSFFVVSIL